MEIAIIAHDKKKELMAQFCIAYYNTLKQHNLCATATTAMYIKEAAQLDLEIERFLMGDYGGEDQIAAKISCNEIDCLLYFKQTSGGSERSEENDLLRLCDVHNIPVATNIATAEILIRAVEAGDLDWRNYVNPKTLRNAERTRGE